jgi:thiamine transport system substrate-binding protein
MTPRPAPLLRTSARRSRGRRFASIVVALAAVSAACGDDDTATDDTVTSDTGTDGTVTSDTAGTVTLVVYDSWPTDDPENPNPLQQAFADFTAETGIDVELLVAGDAGTMLSKAALTAGNPEGDVMWGVDNTLLSRAIEAEVFEPYLADGVDALPERFTALVPDGEATPVDFGDVCVNYDVAALEAAGLEPPASLAELAQPEYASRLVVQNPASSSPGLAFLMATVAELGDGWEQFWTDLRDGGVLVTDGWTEAYYEAFSWAGGDRPLVVSYGSSPPFEVLFAAEPLDAAPTGVVEATCFRQVEFAGVLRGTDAPDAARALVDFLISERFQREIPLNLFVFPVNPDVALDPAFVEYATIPDDPLSLDPARIESERADWIDRWTEIVSG